MNCFKRWDEILEKEHKYVKDSKGDVEISIEVFKQIGDWAYGAECICEELMLNTLQREFEWLKKKSDNYMLDLSGEKNASNSN